MKRIPLTEARKRFAEIVGGAQYGKETTVLTRHGKDIAAVVPMSVLPPPTDPSKRKGAASTGKGKDSRLISGGA